MMHAFIHDVTPLLLLLAGPLVGVILVIQNWRDR